MRFNTFLIPAMTVIDNKRLIPQQSEIKLHLHRAEKIKNHEIEEINQE